MKHHALAFTVRCSTPRQALKHTSRAQATACTQELTLHSCCLNTMHWPYSQNVLFQPQQALLHRELPTSQCMHPIESHCMTLYSTMHWPYLLCSKLRQAQKHCKLPTNQYMHTRVHNADMALRHHALAFTLCWANNLEPPHTGRPPVTACCTRGHTAQLVEHRARAFTTCCSTP